MKHYVKYLLFISVTLSCCGQTVDKQTASVAVTTVSDTSNKNVIDEKGMTLQTRFNPPEGFQRKSVDENSFANYLRNLPLNQLRKKDTVLDISGKDAVWVVVGIWDFIRFCWGIWFG